MNFAHLARQAALWAGKPATFMVAIGFIVAWGLSGPLFGFSDTWQLVVNTTTTVVTFLMVFLIQSSQNNDTIAIQKKLDELIHSIGGADDRVAGIENA